MLLGFDKDNASKQRKLPLKNLAEIMFHNMSIFTFENRETKEKSI